MRPQLHALGLALAAALALGAAAPAATAAQPKPPKDTAFVELVELGDYQCPFSARARTTVAELQKTYGDKLTFRWLEHPLAFHPRARPAAIAAEAARRQGKLEALHELLFANQHALGDAEIRDYALKAGLDLKRFDKDLVDPALAAQVDRDIKVAAALGATGTPTFFVNGAIITGAQPIEKFTALIDAELAAAAGQAGGPAWREARTAANNDAVLRYVVRGEAPPDAPAPKPPTTGDAPPAEAPLSGPPVVLDVAAAPLLGPATAAAEIVVFADLQCPYSARAVPLVEGLVAKKNGAWALRWKHMPLAMHPMARPAAEAVACAAEQGQAWPLIDAIYKGQRDLSDAKLAAWEKAAHLDRKKLAACLSSGRGKAVVDADVKAAEAAGVKGTPTLFVNGLQVRSWAAPDLEAVIDGAAEARLHPEPPPAE